MVRARASALHLQFWVCHRLGERFPTKWMGQIPFFGHPPAPAKLTACHKLRRAWLSSKKGRGGRFSSSTVN